VSEQARQPLLLDLSLAQLERAVVDLGQPAYRARQVYHWLHQRGVLDPQGMTDLPATIREQLAANYDCQPLRFRTQAVSADGSIKYLWTVADTAPVEAVLMPGFDYGTALCASSQSGCGFGCGFCQTGRLGLRAQLSAGQILAQLYDAESRGGMTADRLVLMGMGEPLANLRSVRQVVAVLTGAEGRDWSARRITVSTVGLYKPLVELANTFPRVNLALSLHFTSAEKRRKHMPKAEPRLERLADALFNYRRVNGGKLTIEYALLDGLNDRDRDARRLAQFARLADIDRESELIQQALEYPVPPRQQPLPLHVNLITYNPIPAAPQYRPTDERRVSEFARLLSDAEVPVTVRRSRGADIAAACGQLGSEIA